ncbi:enoyl-CoA hydratase-related protein [Paeniglutamicibacter psychrophenolicus]|uniref:Enoyl-CoA hydratase/carnithine racemase n=1 Tax=Paeniglutamicibacter psychrophenolicus TaxID=257454 RepID=A0ABS4WJR0_9MICC|nr:enoyl-CoA hydratase/isomerase family protein [Paeniglutamicibacter psychrophenolicus]MBP2376435.1 enoyl-CoA hydratase/carnithine racemase [Paeniglutamicibacter psychrophenolicus]
MDTELLDNVTISIDAGIIRLRLNRPDKLNALNIEVGREVSYAVKKYAYRNDAKVMILSGEGSSFCAGHDLNAPWKAESARDRLLEYSDFQQMFVDIERAPVVKIAQVQGHAVGGGLVLPTLCELRYASTDASLRVSELDLGVPLSMGGFPRLARLIGLTRTADLVLTGRKMLAAEGHECGYFTDVFEPADLESRVSKVASALTNRSSFVLMETAKRVREAAEEMLSGHRDDLPSLMAANRDPESRTSGEEYAARFKRPAAII